MVQTAALTTTEARGFIGAGFSVNANLTLLVHEMERGYRGPLVDSPPGPTTRVRWSDHEAVLRIDREAFGVTGELDELGLQGALAATPSVRWRGVVIDGEMAAFAITGRAGRRGYLQRLAVEPAHQGEGLGAALVIDALRWCGRWGARRVVVNTQDDNARALALYRRLGFRDSPIGLCVLERALDTLSTPS